MSVCLAGWLVNTITAVNIYRLQQNFVSGYYLVKLRLGLKMSFMATLLVIDKSSQKITKTFFVFIWEHSTSAYGTIDYIDLLNFWNMGDIIGPILVPPIQTDIFSQKYVYTKLISITLDCP